MTTLLLVLEPNLLRLFLKAGSSDVASGGFDDLEIREWVDGKFHYFFDRRRNRLVKRFLLREGARVDTLCDVVLIKKDEGYTPRLTLWKRDETEKGDPRSGGVSAHERSPRWASAAGSRARPMTPANTNKVSR